MTYLYQIPNEWQAILAELEANGGELTPELAEQSKALITTSKDAIERGVLASRCLALKADLGLAQAKVFAEEADRCKASAAQLQTAADAIAELLVPALLITGKVKTIAGTAYTQTRATWAFEMAPGSTWFELDERFYRQRDPELNKTELKKAAEANALPAQILAAKTESTTVCLRAAAKKEE